LLDKKELKKIKKEIKGLKEKFLFRNVKHDEYLMTIFELGKIATTYRSPIITTEVVKELNEVNFSHKSNYTTDYFPVDAEFERCTAIMELGKIGAKEAIVSLKISLRDKKSHLIRSAAAWSLFKLGERTDEVKEVLLKSVEEMQISLAKHKVSEEQPKIYLKIIDRNEPINQLIESLTKYENHFIRAVTIRALGAFGIEKAEKVVPELVRIISKDDYGIFTEMIQREVNNALELINETYKFANIDVLINVISKKTKIDSFIKQGQSFLENGHIEDALERFKKALELAPKHPKALQGLAKAKKQKETA